MEKAKAFKLMTVIVEHNGIYFNISSVYNNNYVKDSSYNL